MSPVERRTHEEPVPSVMTQTVQSLKGWKLIVLFAVGVVVFLAVAAWFIFHSEGHIHSTSEWVVVVVLLTLAALFMFPVGVMKLLDKAPLPSFLRRERREDP